ncbi:TIM barrel protein [Geodermatophilus sp. SYSU D00698]
MTAPVQSITRRRRSIATVCLSGLLEDKLDAAASAGFDGVELCEPDLVSAAWTPAEVAGRCADLGLSIDLLQPFRDLDSTDPDRFARNLRRVERTLDVVAALGTETLLVVSSVAADAVQDLDRLAAQLAETADRAQRRGLRVAYEALAWGTHVSTWERSWEVVRRAGHPALGLCLDSFHVFARDGDLAGITAVPGDKIFSVQLADAPDLRMDVLRWSRHHRLFPGQGAFDLPGFLGAVLAAGYTGPLSLETFNDVHRSSAPTCTAADAMRSLRWLEEVVARDHPGSGALLPPPAPDLTGWSFAGLTADGTSASRLSEVLTSLGFTRTARSRTEPVAVWEQGGARLLVDSRRSQPSRRGAVVLTSLGVASTDPVRSAQRARAMGAPVAERGSGAAGTGSWAVAAPDGTEIRCTPPAPEGFVPTGERPGAGSGLTRIDHVGLTVTPDDVERTTLFHRAVLGLEAHGEADVPGPSGLLRTRGIAGPDRAVRLALTVPVLRRGEWASEVPEPQYVAFATDDVVATVRALRAAGAPLLSPPVNYADDLETRLDPDPDLLAVVREHGLMYDEDGDGGYLHVATELVGDRVFFLVVQRLGRYDGYGAADAPARMAGHRRRAAGRSPVAAAPAAGTPCPVGRRA